MADCSLNLQMQETAVDDVKLFTQRQDMRIARLPEACLIVGLSQSSIHNRIKEGGRWYDKDFPKPIRLGSGKRCAIGWRVDQLLAYLDRQYAVKV